MIIFRNNKFVNDFCNFLKNLRYFLIIKLFELLMIRILKSFMSTEQDRSLVGKKKKDGIF